MAMTPQGRLPISCWKLVRPAGSALPACNVWAEFREVLPCGAVAFYNVDANMQAREHILAVAPGQWADILQVEIPTLEMVIGRVPRSFRKATP